MGDMDTSQLRAAFVQAQAQIMNNGTYEPVVVISKPLALSLLDEIERLRAAANRTLNAFFCCNGLDNTDLMDVFSEWAVLMNHAAVPEAAAWIAKWEARRG